MKTLLTPSLIAIACFSALTAAAEVAVSAQTNATNQLQFAVSNNSASVSSEQQTAANANFNANGAMQADADTATAGSTEVETDAETESDATVAMPAQPEQPAEQSPLIANTAVDSAAELTGAADSSSELAQNLFTQGIQGGAALTATATAQLSATASTALDVLNSSTDQTTDLSQQLQSAVVSDVALTSAANPSQQLNADLAANTSQQMQQQLSSTTNQLVQQNASAAVTQAVSQAVSAEVSNTVRNTVKLSTGL